VLGTPSSLTWPDFAVLAVALGILLAIGVALAGEQRDTADFFLADRRLSWWAVALSFPVIEAHPRAGHWSDWTYTPGLNPTAGLAGRLHRLGAPLGAGHHL